MITLAIDASTYRGTVAVLDEGEALAEGEAAMRARDAELLLPCVIDTLARSGNELRAVRRVVCGAGPGSFTSLRIAASIAKGISAGLSIPLYGVPSLALIVAGNLEAAHGDASFLALLDAMRGESFAAPVTVAGGAVRRIGDIRIVSTGDVPRVAAQEGAQAVGPDCPGHWQPHARGVSRLQHVIGARGPVDLASWEPEYGRLAEAQARWEATHGRALSP